MRWRVETEGGRRVHRSACGRYRVWEDRDVEHGRYAASVEERGAELILGHRPTIRAAKALAVADDNEQRPAL